MRPPSKIERRSRAAQSERDWRVAFVDGNEAVIASRPDVAWLDDFYGAYDRAFVLPDEKEDIDGFRQCLALNAGEAYERLSARYGAFREVVLLARERTTGRIMGGANFIAFAHADDGAITVNLNYVFVDAAFRRRGVFKTLVDLVIAEARDTFLFDGHAAADVMVFVEINDPVRMDADDYATDSRHAGLDQYDRLDIWSKLGAQLIDFDYGQPALSADQAAEDGLLYGVLGASSAGLSACRLKAHLERFFAISVMKGRDPMDDPQAARQIADLARRCERSEGVGLLGLVAPDKRADKRADGQSDGRQGDKPDATASSYLDLARSWSR